MTTLAQLTDAVKAIKNVDDIQKITQTFNLLPEDRTGKLDQILGVYTGTVDGRSVKVTHRWYDRCRPFSIQPDGNKVELQIDSERVAEGSFLDDY